MESVHVSATLICLLVQFLSAHPVQQSVGAVLVVGVVLLANMYYRPYIRVEYDIFDMLMSTTQVVIILLGILVRARIRRSNWPSRVCHATTCETPCETPPTHTLPAPPFCLPHSHFACLCLRL